MRIQKLQKLSQQELLQIVDIHYSVLTESFINNFGKVFLKIAYQTIFKDPINICFLVKDNNKVTGFLVATINGEKFNKNIIRRNFFVLCFYILKSSLLNPQLIYKLVRWVFAPTGKRLSPELQFIALTQEAQGRGIGTKLINHLNNEFKERKILKYRVGTKAANKTSNSFYKKLKFKFIHQEVFFGDKYNYYISPKY